jgi:hypothetical protein
MVKNAACSALRNNPRIARENIAKTSGSFPEHQTSGRQGKREKLPWFTGPKIGIMARQETSAENRIKHIGGLSYPSK